MAHRVEVALGDRTITGWDEVTIVHDMLAPSSPWALSLWDDGEQDLNELARRARIYTPASVSIDGALQLRGQVERRRRGASHGGSVLTISGRDLAGAMLVADVDPSLSTREMSMVDVIARAVQPLGISVTVGASAQDATDVQAGHRPGARRTRRARAATSSRPSHRAHVDLARPRVGTRVWQWCESLVRRHGFLLYTAPTQDGIGLVIDRPAYDAPVTCALVRRRGAGGTWNGNLLEGYEDLNATELPTEVTTFGHARLAASADARLSAMVLNDGLARPGVADVYLPRPRYVLDERARTPRLAEQRSRRELARAMADFEVYDAVVEGFSFPGPMGTGPQALWAVNTMCRVRDEKLSIDADWLITQVTFVRGRAGGHTTRLRLVPKGALVVEPDPEV